MATTDQQRQRRHQTPSDRVVRNDLGVLETRCCNAGMAWSSGYAQVCEACGDTIASGLPEVLELLNVEK